MCPTVARHNLDSPPPAYLGDASRMNREPYTLTNFANRIRMSSPGIVAAVVLTVAAAGFLLAALIGRGGVNPVANVVPIADQQQTAGPVGVGNDRTSR